MLEKCHSECVEWQEYTLKYKRYQVSDEKKETLFDMSLRDVNGKSMQFDQFEGYVTMILPLAKTCSGSKVAVAEIFDSIDRLQKVWPYAVQILVFAYEHPLMDYSKKNCEDFEDEYEKRANKSGAYMMDELEGLEGHPLFELMKDIMGVDELKMETTHYFVVGPDFSMIEHHYGKSLLDMKDILRELIKELEPEL